MESSPNTRLTRLKKEIKLLDQQIFKSTTERSPIPKNQQMGQSTYRYSPQKKNTQQQQLNNLSPSKKSEHPNTQLSQLNYKLKDLASKKQQQHLQMQEAKNSLENKQKELESMLNAMEEEYQSVSASYFHKQKFHENTHQAKLKAYQESLGTLEFQVQSISEQKQQLQRSKSHLEKELIRTQDCIAMLKEEINSRYTQRAEYIAQREEAEEAYERLKLNGLEEFSDEDFEEGLGGFSKKDEETLKKIRNSEWKVYDIEDQIRQTKQKLQECTRKLSSFQEPEEIQRLENYLKQKCQELQVVDIDEVVLELNTLANFDVDEEILREQLKQVTKQEQLLEKQWDLEEKAISEQIRVANEIEADYEKAEALEIKFEEKHRKHRNKLAAISQWKLAVEEALELGGNFQSTSVKDSSIKEEFKSIALSKVFDYQQLFEGPLTSYLEKAKHRETSIQENLHEDYYGLKEAYEGRLLELLDSKLQLLEEVSSHKESLDIQSLKQSKVLTSSDFLSSNYSHNSQQAQRTALQDQVAYWERYIAYETNIVEKELKPVLERTLTSLSQLKSCLADTSTSLNALESEESALNYQIKQLSNTDLRESTEYSFQKQKRTLTKLKSDMDNLKKELSNVNSQLKKLNHQNHTKISQLEKRENQIKSQIQSLIEEIDDSELEDRCLRKSSEERQPYRKLQKPEPSKETPRSRSLPKFLQARRFIKKPEEDYCPVELKDEEEKKPKLEGNYHECAEKVLGKQPQVYFDKNPLTSSIQPKTKKKYYRFNLEDTSQSEKLFYEKIMPLLEGTEIYKKFSQRNSLTKHAFDPLDSQKTPPESCGYGVRYFRLHKSLTRIDVRQPLKPGFDTSLSLDSIMAPIIPQNTMSILKVQKKIKDSDVNSSGNNSELYDRMKQRGVLDTKSTVFKERALVCSYYPFSIALTQGGRVELIAKSYEDFKHWVNGINALLKYKKHIPKLRSRIESYTSV